jgi:hypothetical protein
VPARELFRQIFYPKRRAFHQETKFINAENKKSIVPANNLSCGHICEVLPVPGPERLLQICLRLTPGVACFSLKCMTPAAGYCSFLPVSRFSPGSATKKNQKESPEMPAFRQLTLTQILSKKE